MDRLELARRIYSALVEFYAKQGHELTEELAFSFGCQAEFIAAFLMSNPSRGAGTFNQLQGEY